MPDTDDIVRALVEIAGAIDRNTEALHQLSSQLVLSSSTSVEALNLSDHEWNVADAVAVGLGDVKRVIETR